MSSGKAKPQGTEPLFSIHELDSSSADGNLIRIALRGRGLTEGEDYDYHTYSMGEFPREFPIEGGLPLLVVGKDGGGGPRLVGCESIVKFIQTNGFYFQKSDGKRS